VQNGVYFTAALEIKAIHLNALEAKVGVDDSTDTSSLDNRLAVLESQLAGIPNDSFEIDSDADGIPDNWDLSLFPGGTAGFETTNPAYGARSYKFVHPGGEGNGGGSLTSDYVLISPSEIYGLFFIHWASVAGIKNTVVAMYFDKDKSSLSQQTLYNSTANPTSPILLSSPHLVIPATARFLRIIVTGGASEVDVAGIAYFDYVHLKELDAMQVCSFGNAYLAIAPTQRTVIGTTWVKTKEIWIARKGSLRCGWQMYCGDATIILDSQIRRNGEIVGTQLSTSATTWQSFTDDIGGWNAGDLCQLWMRSNTGGTNSYVQKFWVGVDILGIEQVLLD